MIPMRMRKLIGLVRCQKRLQRVKYYFHHVYCTKGQAGMLIIVQRGVLVDKTPTSERKVGCELNDQISVVALRLVYPIGTPRSASPFSIPSDHLLSSMYSKIC